MNKLITYILYGCILLLAAYTGQTKIPAPASSRVPVNETTSGLDSSRNTHSSAQIAGMLQHAG
jgi:hypothetical protein